MKDKHTIIVIKFVWLSDYIEKNPVDEQSVFSTANQSPNWRPKQSQLKALW